MPVAERWAGASAFFLAALHRRVRGRSRDVARALPTAQWLGMDIEEDKHLLWIAEEGLKAPLPPSWKPCHSVRAPLPTAATSAARDPRCAPPRSRLQWGSSRAPLRRSRSP